MRFLADENFPGAAVRAIRQMKHEVAWVLEDSPSALDPVVLQRAIAEDRILLTFDKDFGELARSFGLPPSSGIILFRLPMPSALMHGQSIAEIVCGRDDWAGFFSVVEPARIRMRPLGN